MTLDLNCYHGFGGKNYFKLRIRKGYAKFRKEKRCNPAISSCCTELHGLARIREIRGHSGYWSTSEKYQLNQVTIAGSVKMDILFK